MSLPSTVPKNYSTPVIFIINDDEYAVGGVGFCIRSNAPCDTLHVYYLKEECFVQLSHYAVDALAFGRHHSLRAVIGRRILKNAELINQRILEWTHAAYPLLQMDAHHRFNVSEPMIDCSKEVA